MTYENQQVVRRQRLIESVALEAKISSERTSRQGGQGIVLESFARASTEEGPDCSLREK